MTSAPLEVMLVLIVCLGHCEPSLENVVWTDVSGPYTQNWCRHKGFDWRHDMIIKHPKTEYRFAFECLRMATT